MKEIYTGRSGQLENTTFGILSPNGKKKLTRTGRGPFHEYRNASQMAAGMDKIARSYNVEAKTLMSDTSLPYSESVDVGLNISAADNIPMVVIAATDEAEAKALEEKLLPHAWSESIMGQFNYAKATSSKDLSTLTGIKGDTEKLESILIVEPGQFGLSGKVLDQLDSSVEKHKLQSVLVDAIANCQRVQKDHNSHVQLGIQLGVDWESEIPETDAQALNARKRARGQK
jgi:hypothetical protein